MKDLSFGEFKKKKKKKEVYLFSWTAIWTLLVIWRINLVQRINKINHTHFEAWAHIPWSALLHWGLSRSINRIWGKHESRAEDTDLWQSDLAAVIFLPPPIAWKRKRTTVKVPLYTSSLLFQGRTNQKDRELICSKHRAMPTFPRSQFGLGTSWAGILPLATTTSKPSTSAWTAQGAVPALVT